MVKGLQSWLVILSFFCCGGAMAQTHTPKQVNISSQVKGFYEYLPAGYNNNTRQYPLLISIHGRGQLGNGSPSEIGLVAKYGIPLLIEQDKFPTSFTVNGNTFSFIILSPQFTATPTNTDINNLLEYASRTYRVDQSRIYLTGMSMGGGATWDFVGSSLQNAVKIAAIIPVCGATTPSSSKAEKMVDAKLHIWATHNDGDRTTPVAYTNNFISYINALSPEVTPKKTIFPVVTQGDTHDAWTKTYDPAFKEDGMNIYEWMLQYRISAAGAPTPVVLNSMEAQLKNNNEVLITWNTAVETGNNFFTLEKSSNGISFTHLADIPSAYTGAANTAYSFTDGPVSGTVFYRLSQTDLSGKKEYFNLMKVTAKPEGSFRVGPNPLIGTQPLKLFVNDAVTGKVVISLLDSQGRTIKNIIAEKKEAAATFTISTGNLPKGRYIVQYTNGTFTRSESVIKQ